MSAASPSGLQGAGQQEVVTRRSPRLACYLLLGGGSLLAALALRRPEPVALGIPLLLAVALGLAFGSPPELEVTAAFDRARALEGEEILLVVTVLAEHAVPILEIAVTPPRNVEILEAPPDLGRRLPAGELREYRWRLRCTAWSGYLSVGVAIRTRDALGLFQHHLRPDRKLPLRVYPRYDEVRQVVDAVDTGLLAGNERSRQRGEGIEFADVRPYHPGDLQRRINWRATARLGEPQVNEMHPERNTEVVLFLDAFTQLQRGPTSTLDMTVRGGLALARTYLRRRDRVGLVVFGGTLQWLRPEGGDRQLYRILDALIDTQVVLSHAWKGLEYLPPRTLPPRSLVIALSPLLDVRTVRALLDLRARRHDLAVLEISPVSFAEAGPSAEERLAYRLWAMDREVQIARLQASGAAVARWERDEPLGGPLAVQAMQRAQLRA
ncbi:MAG: DUF58 domain-containing protein, partial [Candidatus Dormibacteraceae bacterium]